MTPLRQKLKEDWIKEIHRIHREMKASETDLSASEIDTIRDDLLRGADVNPSFLYAQGKMLDSTFERLSNLYPSHSSKLWLQFDEDWAKPLEAFIREFQAITARYPRCFVRLVDESASAISGYRFQLEWSWSSDADMMSAEDSASLSKAAGTFMKATRPRHEPEISYDAYG
jgi:hypothetical protein